MIRITKSFHSYTMQSNLLHGKLIQPFCFEMVGRIGAKCSKCVEHLQQSETGDAFLLFGSKLLGMDNTRKNQKVTFYTNNNAHSCFRTCTWYFNVICQFYNIFITMIYLCTMHKPSYPPFSVLFRIKLKHNIITIRKQTAGFRVLQKKWKQTFMLII